MQDITGNITGLKPSQKRALARTYHRRVPQDRLLSPELATHLAGLSHTIGRQIGVLINRRGHVEHLFVGGASRIFLPDIGRHRAGKSLLRGLRHVHTVFAGPGASEGSRPGAKSRHGHRDDDHAQHGLQAEDLADLTKLRLDAVAALHVNPSGQPGAVEYATLLPQHSRGNEPYDRQWVRDVHILDLDFEAHIQALEQELARHSRTRETAKGGVRAILVGAYPDRATAEWRMHELRELAGTAGVAVVDTVTQIRRKVDHRFLVGRGKLDDVVLHCLDLDAELVVFDHDLTPAQARAIAASSDLKVIDRTQLILDIFAQHAQSRGGKLQVELAQLRYNLSRLTDLDAGLSRLTGGIGGRGPGETKLEINRRRARDRISRLEQEIQKLSQQRALRRKRRDHSGLPVVSIVGYTNAGKSTLLNLLTRSQVHVANQLFATLDTSSRRLRFPKEREAIITDTVGFIRDLPPDLLKAFRATLEELEGADLLLHVIDASDPERDEKKTAVEELLAELHLSGLPVLVVYNKMDTVERFEALSLARRTQGVAVAAKTGEGIRDLAQEIARRLWQIEALPEADLWAAESGAGGPGGAAAAATAAATTANHGGAVNLDGTASNDASVAQA